MCECVLVCVCTHAYALQGGFCLVAPCAPSLLFLLPFLGVCFAFSFIFAWPALIARKYLHSSLPFSLPFPPSSLHHPLHAFLVFVASFASCAKFFSFFSYFSSGHSCVSFALPGLPGLPWQQPMWEFEYGLQLQLTTFATSVYCAFPADKTKLFPLFPKAEMRFSWTTNCAIEFWLTAASLRCYKGKFINPL